MAKHYKFTQLPVQLNYPRSVASALSTAHSTLITNILSSDPGFSKKLSGRKRVTHMMNTITYMYVSNYTDMSSWDRNHPENNLPDIDDDTLKSTLGALYLNEKYITFDIDDSVIDEVIVSATDSAKIAMTQKESEHVSTSDVQLTPKSDLFIQPPIVPQFDVNNVYARGSIDTAYYTVYASYPTIPKKQNEISVTTDVSKMTDFELKRLYPNNLIRTRSSSMYECCQGITLDPKVGLILPVDGFTEAQVFDNIVKYPHLFKLLKQTDSGVTSFYTTIEVDGKLHNISEIWSELPEAKIIPYSSDFIKEYVVRRYLLERDIKHVDHRYKLYGTLDPYLTLFCSIQDYKDMGYTNIIEMAKSCVKARVSYKRSRNPVLRRLSDE